MRVLVISDTHGHLQHLDLLPAQVGPVEFLLHAGDFLRDAVAVGALFHLAPSAIRAVAGNCDPPGTEPAEQLLELAGVRILLTHGHRYDVKHTLDGLRRRAQQAEARVAIFGHSHVALHQDEGGLILLNPGSPGFPRNINAPGSVGLLTLSGQDVQVEHVEL